jgi:hypothetical protein
MPTQKTQDVVGSFFTSLLVPLERLTKCLCIQAAYFVSGGVGRAKIVLDVVFRYACGDFAPSALPAAKPLAFDATIHLLEALKTTEGIIPKASGNFQRELSISE